MLRKPLIHSFGSDFYNSAPVQAVKITTKTKRSCDISNSRASFFVGFYKEEGGRTPMKRINSSSGAPLEEAGESQLVELELEAFAGCEV